MLVLARRPGEKIRIGDDCVLTVIRVFNNRVWLGFDAPKEKRILREEVWQKVQETNSENQS